MKNYALASLIAVLATAATGCIIESGDDTTSDYAIVSAQWDLKNEANQSLTCPPGITTAAVHAQAVDANYNLVPGSERIDLYDCEAHAGNSDPLAPTMYQVWVELTPETGGIPYAVSTSKNERAATENYPDAYFLDVTDVDQTFKTTIFDDAGYIQFDWDIRDASNQPAACGGPIASIGLLSTSVSNANVSFDDKMHCNALNYGLTGDIPAGTYTVEISAVDANNRDLGAPTEKANVVVKNHNQVTDLGTVQVHLQ